MKDSSKAQMLCLCFGRTVDYAHLIDHHLLILGIFFFPLDNCLVLYCIRIIPEIRWCLLKKRLNGYISVVDF